jgi:hypothetical protein
MMKMHEQMMAEVKAGDAKFDALVKDIMLRQVTPRSTQWRPSATNWSGNTRAMHERMGQMHQQMMGRGMGMRR